MAIVSLWTPLAFERIAARWFATPNIYYLWPVPLLTAATAFALWRWLETGRDIAALHRGDRPVPAGLRRDR